MTSRTASERRHSQSGFTLIEILMGIALLAIVGLLASDMVMDSVNESRFQQTVSRMNAIKNAILGDPNIKEHNSRTSFGYLGDMGAQPTTIQDLITQPVGSASFAIDATSRVGMGWNGPYLSSDGTSYSIDAWGTPFTYNMGANIISLGANLIATGTGYNQDITVDLPLELTSSTVSGYVCWSGGAFNYKAEIELNYPDGTGNLSQVIVTDNASDKGAFSFASVPLGVRSITVWSPTKAYDQANNIPSFGPIVITVDKPNYVVPCNLIDYYVSVVAPGKVYRYCDDVPNCTHNP